MSEQRRSSLTLWASVTFCLLAASVFTAKLFARQNSFGSFWIHSTTFSNGSVMPISTINNIVSNGVNGCSINGAPGGNQSPELSWGGVPPGTRSFVVTAYDVTASFTHWGMYNIPGNTNDLPENAGVKNSSYGLQIVNDFGSAAEYDGPCPPANVAPYVHHYVFTVYALDTELQLPGSANFPSNAETLYHALIDAGRSHHILASASIIGLYSTTQSTH